jgi:hypothetical protein
VWERYKYLIAILGVLFTTYLMLVMLIALAVVLIDSLKDKP